MDKLRPIMQKCKFIDCLVFRRPNKVDRSEKLFTKHWLATSQVKSFGPNEIRAIVFRIFHNQVYRRRAVGLSRGEQMAEEERLLRPKRTKRTTITSSTATRGMAGFWLIYGLSILKIVQSTLYIGCIKRKKNIKGFRINCNWSIKTFDSKGFVFQSNNLIQILKHINSLLFMRTNRVANQFTGISAKQNWRTNWGW